MGVEEIANNEYALGIAEKIANSYNIALGLGAVLALGIIVYAGVRYASSAGNPSAIEDAKKWITAAIGGLLLLFSTVLILNVIDPRLSEVEDPFLEELEPIEPREGVIEIGSFLARIAWLEACVEGGDSEEDCIDQYAEAVVVNCVDSGGSSDECRTQCINYLGPAVMNAFAVTYGVFEDDIEKVCDKYSRAHQPAGTCNLVGEGCVVSNTESCCEGLYCKDTSGGAGYGECTPSPFTEVSQEGLAQACSRAGDNNIEQCSYNEEEGRVSCPFFRLNLEMTKATCDNNLDEEEGFDLSGSWCETCQANGGVRYECEEYKDKYNAGCCGKVEGLCSY